MIRPPPRSTLFPYAPLFRSETPPMPAPPASSPNQQLQNRRNAAMPRGVGVMCGFHAVQADNALLTDAEGRQYIDFAAGIAVLNTGHRHPRVVQAVQIGRASCRERV